MSGRRDPERRLLGDLKRVQCERDAALQALAETNDLALRVMYGDVLHDFDDLERCIGISTVTDSGGRIRWRELQERVLQLRQERPHLFVSRPGGVGGDQ